ncbi:MAG TPA: MarC family protein [Holophaga sp.]|nr:MarC family protein [Holophaga sp.]
MPDLLNRTFFTFLALFPILNPPAMAPVFLNLTAGVSDGERNRLSRLIGTYTFTLLTALLFIGGWALKLLGISIPVISVAGGLLLFHSAWHMLNRDPRMSDSEREEIRSSMRDKAFFPLTLPVTAGPGAIAVTLSLVPAGNVLEAPVLLRYLAVTGGIALAALSVYVFYRFSAAVMRRMGSTGAATVSQLSAFVLLAIGVQIIWNGVRGLIGTM